MSKIPAGCFFGGRGEFAVEYIKAYQNDRYGGPNPINAELWTASWRLFAVALWTYPI